MSVTRPDQTVVFAVRFLIETISPERRHRAIFHCCGKIIKDAIIVKRCAIDDNDQRQKEVQYKPKEYKLYA